MRFGTVAQPTTTQAQTLNLVPGQLVCLSGRVEPLFFTQVVGQPRPADFGLNLIGVQGNVPITSTQPNIQQLLPALQNVPVLACGVIREQAGTGPLANVRVRFLDAFSVVPLSFLPFIFGGLGGLTGAGGIGGLGGLGGLGGAVGAFPGIQPLMQQPLAGITAQPFLQQAISPLAQLGVPLTSPLGVQPVAPLGVQPSPFGLQQASPFGVQPSSQLGVQPLFPVAGGALPGAGTTLPGS